MLNSKPSSSKFHSGLYVPKNNDKVIKLNAQGGVFYRSSWEYKFMIFLDSHPKITRWMSEGLQIQYVSKEVREDMLVDKDRCYYPDFYYEMINAEGSTEMVVVEIKPKVEVNDVQLLREGRFIIPDNASTKQLKGVEYKLKMAQKNSAKWKYMVEWCNRKGFKFIIITEDHISKMRG